MQNILRSSGILLLVFVLAACNLGTNTPDTPTAIVMTATPIAQLASSTPTDISTQTAIPSATTPACQPQTDWLTYTVVSGDTLSRIARRGNTTVDTLVTVNCLSNANLISPGQVLYVPYAVTTATPVPTAIQGCQYYTTGAPPIYTSQTFETVLSTVVTNQRYPLLGRTNFSYQIQLPDGQVGWVQSVSGILEGNCDAVPVVDTSCQYFSFADVPIYENQSYQAVIGTSIADQRYIALDYNQWNYHIQLPDGRTGWTQRPTGALAGNCERLALAALSYVEQGITHSDICYFVSANPIVGYNDQAHMQFGTTLNANIYYRVDARAGEQYRLVAGGDLPYPLWVDLHPETDSISGNCNHLPDLSIATTLTSPRISYTEPSGAFAFDYPSNWQVTELTDGMGGGSTGSYSLLRAYPSALPWPDDVVWIFWSPAEDFMGNTAEEVVNTIVNDILSNANRLAVTQMPEQYVTTGGISTWHFRVEGVNAPRDSYVFEQDGQIWTFSVQGFNDYGHEVLESLRPA